MAICNVGTGNGAKAVADLLMFDSTLITLEALG